MKPKFLSIEYKANNSFVEKEVFNEKREWRIEPKTTRKLFNRSSYGDWKDPTTSIRKHANELKVHEETKKNSN